MRYGYARVSTVGQSLESQIMQLELSHCDCIYQEKVSGKSTDDRAELKSLLSKLCTGDQVIVTKLDRLARSTKDLLTIAEQIDKQKSSLIILNINIDTGTPTGKLMLTLLGAIAEFEREMMLERQKDGIARAKENGKYKGRKPVHSLRLNEVLALAQQGFTRAKIASECQMSLMTVHRILKAA